MLALPLQCSNIILCGVDRVEIIANPPAMIVGQRFELRCAQENTSTSVTNITWSSNSGTLTSTTDMGAEVLIFDPVTSGDAGNYTCSIEYNTNTLRGTYEFTPFPGRSSVYTAACPEHIMHTSLFPLLEPTVEVTGSRNSFTTGVNTTLNCVVSGADNLGSPRVNYVWMRDSDNITGQVGSSLVLGSLTTNDSGSYTCTVTIKHDLLSTPITVTSTTAYSITVTAGTHGTRCI